MRCSAHPVELASTIPEGSCDSRLLITVGVCSGFHFSAAPSPFDDPEVTALAKKYEKTPAQILLRLQLDRGFAVIPKSVTPARIQENFQVSLKQLIHFQLFDFELTGDEVARLLETEQYPRRFEFDMFVQRTLFGKKTPL